MSTATPSPATPYSPSAPPRPQPLLPTPSPFSFSVTSNRWTSRPPIWLPNLLLRFLTLVLSAASAVALAAASSTDSNFRKDHSAFQGHPEFMYCFVVNILIFIYEAYQVFKGICDISYRGIFVSDKVSDYVSFTFDQLAGYLLVSISSVSIPAIQEMNNEDPLMKAAKVSVSLSFTLFVVNAITALMSSYTLCKRIIR